ncbi:hypothetical protein [Arenimonas sp.]|uniref:hypothetical protein n=1 Tax=Arenimonas sp. TaxID=1872635 RepID=UPI0039E56BD9
MLAVSIAPTVAANSVDAPPDPWRALFGEWQGKGEVRGMSADVRLRFEATLDGQGRRLSFHNTMTDMHGKAWLFLAEAIYLCAPDGNCRGQWQDSRGMVLPLSTRSQADRVIVDWGDADSERGRTTYRVMPDGSLEIEDEVLDKSGAWKVFGRTKARRLGNEAALTR